ncbi:DxFTY motif-containing membrane protein [Spiroplasma endosymbiont of Apeira syringaria]|uniref:DxFTY motif-containing membrane protein n=1 Tax=Spiroplasma endosymbiont of Apeira syringaria TaxID=3066307 RepID=UPI0030CF59C5
MENKNQEVNFENNSENTFPRTKFFLSVGYLIIQVLIPGIILFFTTSTDFTFKLPFWIMVLSSLILIIFTFIITFITYKLKLHQLDQFTYSIPFAFVLSLFYLSGYFLTPQQILIRFIISIAGAVIGIFLTSIILLLVLRKKQKKSYIKL